MRNKRATKAILLLTSLIVSVLIIFYYWSVNNLVDITKVPNHVLILVIVYIALQFLKRRILNEQFWWSSLYYPALISIVLPVFFANATNFDLFRIIAQIGSVFLIIPILIDGYKLTNSDNE